MSNFSTEFPVDRRNTITDVVRLACKWIAGSPHSKIRETDLREIPIDSERTFANENESLTIAHANGPEFEIGGIQYIKKEKNLTWTTSIVTFKTEDSHLISIQVICEALNTATRLPPPKKPYFIRQVISELGGGSDGDIPVTEQPYWLEEQDANVAAALILGTAKNTLPIIYISADFQGKHQINANDLAKFVSGMAHVIVEPSRSFSFKVKKLTEAKNVFGGKIGVYWPKSQARKTYIVDDEESNARVIQLQVAKDIRVALSNRRQATACTWANLKEIVARNRIEQLKMAGSTELKEYIDAFDADILAKQSRLAEAEEEIGRLTAEIRKISAAGAGSTSGLIQRGVEQDLYQNEISDIIIDALANANQVSRDGSRRQHVLHDLVKSNPPSSTRRYLENEIKTLLRAYKDMDNKTKNALGKLGFDISDDGKHYKAIFQGDGRYTFSISKTSSDHRSGLNLASDINNTLF